MKDRNWNRVQDISLRALPWFKAFVFVWALRVYHN